MTALSATDENPTIHSVGLYETSTLQDNTSFQHGAPNRSLMTECVILRYNASQYLPWDNPHNILKEEVYTYSATVKDYVLAVSFLIGGPANVINMVVFFMQGLQDRVNLCLFMLAVSDNIYLTSALFLHGENIYLHTISAKVINPANEFMMNNNLLFLLGAAFVSFTLSAIIACERCYCVLRPLKYQTLLRTRTMAVIIAVAYVCAFSLFFIVSYRYWIGCVFDPVTGEVSNKIIGGGLHRTHKLLVYNLDSVFFGVIVPGSTMIVVTVTTIITTVKLREIVKWRSETSSSLSSQEVALTKMLIGNSVLFIICVSPSFVFRVAFFFLPHMSSGGLHHNFYLTTLCFTEGFGFINCACNFFIYYTMGSKYRDTFWTLFKRKTKDRGARK